MPGTRGWRLEPHYSNHASFEERAASTGSSKCDLKIRFDHFHCDNQSFDEFVHASHYALINQAATRVILAALGKPLVAGKRERGLVIGA